MPPSLENKRVRFTIKWISMSGDMTDWEDYVYYLRHIVGTKERAMALATAFMNKVRKVPELQEKVRRKRPNHTSSYIAILYESREQKGKWKHQTLSLNLCEMRYAEIYEDGKGIVERIPF